jgi:hypothetical protein
MLINLSWRLGILIEKTGFSFLLNFVQKKFLKLLNKIKIKKRYFPFQNINRISEHIKKPESNINNNKTIDEIVHHYFRSTFIKENPQSNKKITLNRIC